MNADTVVCFRLQLSAAAARMCTQRNPSVISTQTVAKEEENKKGNTGNKRNTTNASAPSVKTTEKKTKSSLSTTSSPLASMTKSINGDIVTAASNDKETPELSEDGNQMSSDTTNEFNVQIVKETNNSITLQWNLISETDVYEIEVHHKVKGWLNVAWTSKCAEVVNNLGENFGYLLRVKALKLDTAAGIYRTLHTSPNVVGCTLAAEPTTICLFRAIRKDQQFLVKRILRRRPTLIEYPGPNGYLPLANAIAFSDLCTIDTILMYGASVHVGNPSNNRTPLHAFYYGRLPVARMLLNKKANMEARDIYGLTPSHLAVDANQGEVLKFALENGANIEARDACGWTLLMRAVIMDSDLNILKLLINHDANMESRDMNDLSCQYLAHLYRNEKSLEYFKKVIKQKKENKAQNKSDKS